MTLKCGKSLVMYISVLSLYSDCSNWSNFAHKLLEMLLLWIREALVLEEQQHFASPPGCALFSLFAVMAGLALVWHMT